MKGFILFLLMIIICIGIGQAATLQGTVYDDSLAPMKNVLVEIDSGPVQRLLAQEGRYTFELPRGAYIIKVMGGSELKEVLTEEKVTMDREGVFTVDLFVFPEVGGIAEDFDADNAAEDILDVLVEKKNDVYKTILFLIVVLVIAVIIRRKYLKKERLDENSADAAELGTDKLLEKIKSAGGRITQKELRKLFPFSEAKVSLMITELEAKGKIEKIKKGRGNVLILKK